MKTSSLIKIACHSMRIGNWMTTWAKRVLTEQEFGDFRTIQNAILAAKQEGVRVGKGSVR